MQRPQFDTSLAAIATAVSAVDVAGGPGAPRPAEAGPELGLAASQRERLLQAASTLFAERGFSAVALDDIGALLGVSGTSAYRHFSDRPHCCMPH